MIFTKDIDSKPHVEARTFIVEEYVLVGPRPARKLSWPELEQLLWLSGRSEENYWFEFVRAASRHGVKLPAPSIEIADLESLNHRLEGAASDFAPRAQIGS